MLSKPNGVLPLSAGQLMQDFSVVDVDYVGCMGDSKAGVLR